MCVGRSWNGCMRSVVISERSCMGVKDLKGCKRHEWVSKTRIGVKDPRYYPKRFCIGVKDPRYYPKRFCMGVKDPKGCKRLEWV